MYKIDFSKPIHIHFIGIGGISMSGLAEILHEEGFTISGSDSKESDLTKTLAAKGIKVIYGQSADNITSGIDLVVYTAAIHESNPEFAAAKAAGIPMLTRAELLGQIMDNYDYSIAVAGTHGKTTTTSMISEILLAAQTDPTISVGGILSSIHGNLRDGDSEYFISEACEYTNSFLNFRPRYSIILNIEAEHLDFFKDINDIRHSFREYASNTLAGGATIINGEIDDEGNQLTTVDEDGNTVLISTGGRPTRLQGISLTPDTKRLYPFGSLAGNVIGFVNANNMGAYGLEASYDDVLSGSTGLTITPTNVNGTPLLFSGGEQMFDAENGSSLVLTLDTNVQYALEKGLESMLDKYDAANGGTGIVMDVNTGGIVAMASYPNYDPGDFSTIYTEGLQAELDAALAEIQQNSNTTYRVYDYGRRGADGKLRPLHIEKALDVTNLSPIAPTAQYPAQPVDGGSVRRLESCKYFISDVVEVSGKVHFTVGTETFRHLLALDGEAVLETASGSYPMKKGDSVLLPAGLGAYSVKGSGFRYIVTGVEEKLG